VCVLKHGAQGVLRRGPRAPCLAEAELAEGSTDAGDERATEWVVGVVGGQGVGLAERRVGVLGGADRCGNVIVAGRHQSRRDLHARELGGGHVRI